MTKHPNALIPTRRSLLTRLKNWDDQEGWREFFNTYWNLIYGVAVKAGLSDAEAQDVVQETVIAVARKMQDFHYDPSIGTFKSWLLHTTRWKIADQFRKRLPAQQSTEQRTGTGTGTTTIERIPDPEGLKLEDIWDQEWEANLLHQAREQARRKTSALQFQIYDLYVHKDWPVSKVASSLGVSAGRVYLAKHRVSNLIRKELKALQTQTF